MTSLLLLWVAVGSIHIGVPLAYFAAMRRIGARRSYPLTSLQNREPTVSIIIPTYNEASVIKAKLSNIIQADYPPEKLQLIIVDSASTDGTADQVREFFRQSSLEGTVVEEEARTGKSQALNIGLRHARGELVCISDAECKWRTDALRNAVRYFSDPRIGSVSGVHDISNWSGTMAGKVEGSYRSVYRMLRIAESKLSSTPIGEGEIQLFRNHDLVAFDPNVGGDDTCGALCMIEKGFRAISADDVVFFDPAPLEWNARFRQKIRRGQHVLQAFLKHKNLLRGHGTFSRFIFPMEFFIYVVNPIIFPTFLILTGMVMATIPLLGYLLLAGVTVAVAVPSLRTSASTYLSNNITMLAAIIQEARGNKQLVWTKIEENRPVAQPLDEPLIAR